MDNTDSAGTRVIGVRVVIGASAAAAISVVFWLLWSPAPFSEIGPQGQRLAQPGGAGGDESGSRSDAASGGRLTEAAVAGPAWTGAISASARSTRYSYRNRAPRISAQRTKTRSRSWKWAARW